MDIANKIRSKKKTKEYNKAYKDKHKEELREKQREYAKNRRMLPEIKEKRRKETRIRTLAYYGLKEEEYQDILESQGGVCAICGNPPKTRALNVDHEHQSKDKKRTPESRKIRIRGLLCYRCNRALGIFGNEMMKLLFVSRRLNDYMERYYIKRIADLYGEEANQITKNAVEYLSAYERKRH